MVKRTIFLSLSAAVLCMAYSGAAYSQLGVQLNLGGPPVYAPPPPPPVMVAPAYVSPYPSYYDPGHRHHDFEYWRERRHHEHDHR